MTYPLLISLGLLFLAVSFLVTHSTGRIATVVLASVMFLIAVVVAGFGSPWG